MEQAQWKMSLMPSGFSWKSLRAVLEKQLLADPAGFIPSLQCAPQPLLSNHDGEAGAAHIRLKKLIDED